MSDTTEKSTILYLDDEIINLSGFKFVFRSSYRVLTATSPLEALDHLANNEVKVIISDQKMPEMSGTDFLKSIADEYPETIKIILTAYADSDTAINAINEANIYQFLIKPWNKSKIEETLRNAIDAYDLAKTNAELIISLRNQNEAIQIANNQLKEEIHIRLQTERALIQSEKKFRQIFNDSSDGILIWNKTFNIINVNNAVQSVLGYTKDELLSRSLSDLVTEEYHSIIAQRAQLLLNGEIPDSIEMAAIHKNGRIIPVEVNSRSILISDEQSIISIVRDISLRKQQEQIILDATVQTEERERQRFAQDLHDDFGPTLSSVKLYLRLLKEQLTDKKPVEIITTIESLIDESISIIRSTSNALSSHVLVNYGLVDAINHTVEKFREFIHIEFDTNLQKERFPQNMETIIYRILNELLNNTIKHAGADKVKINLIMESSSLALYYTDNGIGFDLEQKLTDKKGGIGIFNIFNRIRTIGGKYDFDTAPGKGVSFNLKTKTEIINIVQ